MPNFSRGPEITRGTITRDRWKATVTIIGSDRIPAGDTPSLLFVTIAWRRVRDGHEAEAGRPDDAKPIVLEFKPRSQAGGGDIHFDAKDGPRLKGFTTDTQSMLNIFGARASAGAQPDVDLVIKIEDEERGRLPMSVGAPAVTVTIQLANGNPPPSVMPLEVATGMKVVVNPAGQGTFTWISVLPNVLEFRNFSNDRSAVDVIAHAPPAGQRFMPLVVVFTQANTNAVQVGTVLLDARESITFIMGQSPPNPRNDIERFYLAARAFLTLRTTAPVVDNRRSLEAVRDYLANNAPANHLPWGDISIVSHGNEEGWMDAFVLEAEAPDGQHPKATPETVRPAIQNGSLRPLSDNIVDARTLLRIRGCAVGRSQEMLHDLSVAFGGDDPQRPIVRAPKQLQSYEFFPQNWRINGPPPTRADEYFLEFWFLSFPEGQVPDRATLEQRFPAAFPDAGHHRDDRNPVDWHALMPAAQLRTRDAANSNTRDTRVEYLPDPGNNSAQLRSLIQRNLTEGVAVANAVITNRSAPDNQGRVTLSLEWDQGNQHFTGGSLIVGPMPPQTAAAALALARLLRRPDPDRFTWSAQKDHSIGGDRRQFTLHGARTIVRVERELTEPDPDHPGQRRRAHPAMTDLEFFGAEIPPGGQ